MIIATSQNGSVLLPHDIFLILPRPKIKGMWFQLEADLEGRGFEFEIEFEIEFEKIGKIPERVTFLKQVVLFEAVGAQA